MNDTVRTGLNRVRLPISPSTLYINHYTNFFRKSQDLNGIIEKITPFEIGGFKSQMGSKLLYDFSN